MRIIAGEFRSRTLVTPAGSGTRPTMDRARESLFNVLAHQVSFDGISVLDLFAGSGALGFEALSRGAQGATFVDKNVKAIAAIERNAYAFGVRDRVTIVRRAARSYLEARPQGTVFDLILVDPPYDDPDIDQLAKEIIENGWLTPTGICVIEHRADTSLPPVPAVHVIRELRAGEASFTILTHAA